MFSYSCWSAKASMRLCSYFSHARLVCFWMASNSVIGFEAKLSDAFCPALWDTARTRALKMSP